VKKVKNVKSVRGVKIAGGGGLVRWAMLMILVVCYPVGLFSQVSMVAWPNEGEETVSSNPHSYISYNGKVYFTATDGMGPGLWVTDGTEKGTQCVTHECTIFYPIWYEGMYGSRISAVVMNDYLYFLGPDINFRHYLWRSDGTREGTIRIKEFFADMYSATEIATDGKRLFICYSGKNIYVSDSSGENIHPVFKYNKNIFRVSFGAKGVFFWNLTELFSGELYYSDYTEEGTKLLGKIGSATEYPYITIASNQTKYYFISRVEEKYELWLADANRLNIRRIKEWTEPVGFYSGANKMVMNGDTLVLAITVYNGKSSAISLEYYLEDLQIRKLQFDFPYQAQASGLIKTRDGILFSSTNSGTDYFRVVSGTDTVKEFSLTGQFFPDEYFNYKDCLVLTKFGTLYLARKTDLPIAPQLTSVHWAFPTDELLYISKSIGYNNNELTALGDPAGNPFLVRDINSERQNAGIRELTSVGDKIFFSANTKAFGPELWVTGGDTGSSRLVKDIDTVKHGQPCGLVEFRNKLYFTALGGQDFQSMNYYDFTGLWSSDGTLENTVQVENMMVTESINDTRGRKIVFNNRLFFSGGPKVNVTKWDFRLFSTNGEPDEAKLYANYLTDKFPPDPILLSKNKDHLLYLAGNDLMMTNGDENVTSLNQLTGHSWNFYHYPDKQQLLISEKKWFFTANTVTGTKVKREIWVTDQTANGTIMLTDQAAERVINHDYASTYIQFLTAFSDQLIFAMDTDPDGKELWYTDGTPEKTIRLTGYDDEDRSLGKDFKEAVMFDGYFYGVIRDEKYGTELWISNGTPQGTHVFLDLVPGVQSSYPSNLTIIGDYLYFFTQSDGLSENFWRTDGSVQGTVKMDWNYPRMVNFKESLVHKGDLFFVASHPEYGQALFRYDLGGSSGRSDELRVTSDGISVYPNPVSERLNLYYQYGSGHPAVESNKPAVALIYSVHGQLLREVKITGGHSEIDVSNLNTGIYIVRIEESSVKFIKE
jgi:ELWxxDGT repeat protein